MRLSHLLIATTLVASSAVFAAAPAMEKDGKLVDSRGMTLYTFDKDSKGMSACNDDCAKNWPPLVATKNSKPSGDWTIVERKDGSMQWAYEGMPLYTYAKDKKAGDTTGDGKGDNWHIAKP
ncbi:hypothetical protein [Azomonas macrocytogenes]|uniref:Putative lipoprotein with Yx(FWY)xxD motif n=1 Tax=Azomonas macrocytogenes TaxID=69962 RepID=A0A839SZI6_AZOMA|nr:hypothetical protein [Azomonas macrocytogenes]MBB3102562.1 putative lipoprotein with Yx(FWY)xxD motif [Azomonas macrocytogenes]